MVSPSDRTDEVSRLLTEEAEVTNLVVLPGAARKPTGDFIVCDVTRSGANDVIDMLDRLDVDVHGSIVAERVDLMLGRAASINRENDETVVWEELQQRVDDSSRLTWSYLAFLVIAVLIAAIGIVRNSSILIVGAMVLGPEFGPVAALSFAVLRRRFDRFWRAVRTLAVGFAVAIAITAVFALVMYQIDWIEPSILDDPHRASQFIVDPDRWSLLVALLAGVAGVLSLTSDKSQVLVGVFISVTTVPAAANAAVAAPLAHWDEVGPSLTQLVVNLTGMSVSGTLTLAVLLMFWGRAGLRQRLAHGHHNVRA
ncbi:putative hydrophobic protein (TIGR00271 family) [Stackebrandtia endophytica]|uniref:Putative hydrophobic protein (TIGR00271 family) n=1 Tax=Stackebrandtia endophytica TaxID=1496996 RepID=A0A543B2K4_9ACTN|nr:putative hydrophobic protein (TIGR00271 family) [Stackebrandtia endophytica]